MSIGKARMVVVCAFAFAAPITQADPAMIVGSDRVVATGITPRGEAILFGRSIAYEGGIPVLARHAFAAQDDDGDGTVAWIFDDMPERSTWVAVDLDNGAYAIGWAESLPPRVITVSPQEWREDDDAVDLSREYLDFLLVRPRKGAWALEIREGSIRDADSLNDHILRLKSTFMKPLFGKESPPPRAAKKDVLVIIDLFSLDVAVITAE